MTATWYRAYHILVKQGASSKEGIVAIEGTVTDMVEFCRQWEELEGLIESIPLPKRPQARELMHEIGELVTLNMPIRAAYANWIKGMPEHALVIEDILRQEGYGLALDGF